MTILLTEKKQPKDMLIRHYQKMNLETASSAEEIDPYKVLRYSSLGLSLGFIVLNV